MKLLFRSLKRSTTFFLKTSKSLLIFVFLAIDFVMKEMPFRLIHFTELLAIKRASVLLKL